MEDWTRACGARAGVGFGEGFRHYTVHPYPREPLVLNRMRDKEQTIKKTTTSTARADTADARRARGSKKATVVGPISRKAAPA